MTTSERSIVTATTAADVVTVEQLDPEAQQRIRRYQASAQAGNTSRAYQAQLGAFEAWCKRAGFSGTLPVPPSIIAAWLTERAEAGASRSTLNVALAAIKAGHRVAGARFDDADPDLKMALAGARREAIREQRQAAPLKPVLLGNILASLGGSDLDKRNAALLSLMYMAALRRSELAMIDFAELGEGFGILRLAPEGLKLTLLRSKNSQEEPITIGIAREHNPRGFAALEAWISHAAIAPGSPLFRRVFPRGGIGGRLNADSIGRAVKAAVATYYRSTGASLDVAERLATLYGGHSGRVGFIVAAKEAGASDSDVAATSRHKSLEMIKRYGRQADQEKRAPHQLKGVGLK